MVTHTRNLRSAFTHPKCTHTAVNTHTRSSGQPFMLRRPGSSCGFGALLKGTSVVVLRVERALDISITSPLGHDYIIIMYHECSDLISIREIVHNYNFWPSSQLCLWNYILGLWQFELMQHFILHVKTVETLFQTYFHLFINVQTLATIFNWDVDSGLPHLQLTNTGRKQSAWMYNVKQYQRIKDCNLHFPFKTHKLKAQWNVMHD